MQNYIKKSPFSIAIAKEYSSFAGITVKSYLKVFKTVQEVLTFRENTISTIGFVPTMGALHAGHLSLIAKSKAENSFTGCSIFVNPIQFTNPEDFDKYPQTLERDLEMLTYAGCDFVFAPSVKEMYPANPVLKFDFGNLEHVMEGAFRPGHFNGVAIVVSKLFHAVNPSIAYFGRKDLQQTLVIKRMVSDLGFALKISVAETLREPDGLAMSSRNVRLSPNQRAIAPVLYQTLVAIQKDIVQNQDTNTTLVRAKSQLAEVEGLRLEYLEIANTETLEAIDNDYSGEIAICIAAYLGTVRLIDNVVFVKSV